MRSFVQVKQVKKEIKGKGGKHAVTAVYSAYKASGKDIMKKGGKFYAILDRDTGMWSTDESDVVPFIDREITRYIEKHFEKDSKGDYIDSDGLVITRVEAEYLDDSTTNRLKEFNIWFSNLPPNHNYVQLDTELTFKDETVTPEMHRSKRLMYNLSDDGPVEAYEKLMSVLYTEENRQKIEWCIGAVLSGESKKIEKMLVLYGDPGSGKSTILDLIKMIFSGYWSVFVAEELVNKTSQFATAAFKDNPLIAIQDDGSLYRIESPIINEIISHKDVMINEKGKQQYTIKSNAMLFLATNDTVDIHDTRLGITRRLLDVYPSGDKIPGKEYYALVSKLPFEIGGIAKHCLDVFKILGKNYYDTYSPEEMINKTNYIRNFLFDNLGTYTSKPFITRNDLYNDYVGYCEQSGIRGVDMFKFTEQVKGYFEEYKKTKWNGQKNLSNVFVGLKIAKVAGFDNPFSKYESEATGNWLTEESLDSDVSQLNLLYPNTPAQQATKKGGPCCSWDECRTRLCDVDCRELHWFKLPEDVIKIDFDLKDAEGNKSLELNLKAANKFPKTYAEISKSGCGIHLYYIYDGDPNELSRIYDENIEVKVSTGNNSHRRILTRCNSIPVNHISTGLPLKEKKPVVDNVPITVNGLRTTIKRCLAKEIHADTRSNVDWIYEVLERAYESGLIYDLSDMKEEVEDFCSKSTHQSEYCKKKFGFMKFKSKSIEKVSLKGGKLLIDGKAVEDESAVRYYIQKVLDQPPCPERVAELFDIFKKAYDAGLIYDLSDMKQTILIYTIEATKDQNDKLVAKIAEMKMASIEEGSYDDGYNPDDPIIFFDFEVKPNMNLLCWKYRGKENKVMKVFNPTPQYIAEFFGLDGHSKKKIIGFNNKGYDNHIAYAIWLGKTPYEVFLISKAIINDKNSKAKYREAKNLSYSDILDFMPEKIGLKKWEIRLKIPHQEFNRPWDEPIDESEWPALASYCENDVLATEAVFECEAGQAAWKARNILVDLNNMLVGPGSNLNDSTNDLTTRLIVGDEKDPQKYFVYPDLSEEFPGYEYDQNGIDPERYVSKDVIISGKSIYRGYDPGEGGFVYAEEGMYGLSESDDSASHHPSTIKAKNGFGKFTPNFNRLLDLRLMIKHKEYDKIREQYPALSKYLNSDKDAKDLSYALKIAINSVYGLTAAKFTNKLRDPRNKDNWVAKRGALFMIDLMLNVKEQGYKVLHCKTDSIKVLDPDDNIRNYIYEYGKKFGYTFEVEHRFDRICLVNDAVYVCKYTDEDVNEDMAGKWDATGKQFQVPYVFKTLFSHEPIEFDDMCETKNTSTAFYLDMNENLPEGEHDYVFIGKTGKFTPIKEGCGGGILYRDDGKGGYASAESSKGFRWLESDTVLSLHKEDDIDRSYYTKLVDKAVEKISKYGDLEAFTAEGKYVDMSFMNIPETDDEEVPFL